MISGIPLSVDKRWTLAAVLVTAAGLAARLAHLYRLMAAPALPYNGDTGTFLEIARQAAHPFDTSPREPLFAWWLWLLNKMGAASPLGTMLWTTFWYLPCAALLWRWARAWAGPAWGLGVLALWSAVPFQIGADTAGQRHSLETFFLLGLFNLLLRPSSTEAKPAAAGWTAAAVLTRLNHLVPAALLYGWRAAWRRDWRRGLLFAGVLAAALAPHLWNNRTRHGDALHSINLHSYWYANKEFIGRPGFPATHDEWMKDVYRPSLTYRRWAFQAHTLTEYVRETLLGFGRCLGTFVARDYYGRVLPAAAGWLLTGLYAWGFVAAALSPATRSLPAALALFVWPYAFVSHVFTAPRFFMPLTPVTCLLTVMGLRELVRKVKSV